LNDPFGDTKGLTSVQDEQPKTFRRDWRINTLEQLICSARIGLRSALASQATRWQLVFRSNVPLATGWATKCPFLRPRQPHGSRFLGRYRFLADRFLGCSGISAVPLALKRSFRLHHFHRWTSILRGVRALGQDVAAVASAPRCDRPEEQPLLDVDRDTASQPVPAKLRVLLPKVFPVRPTVDEPGTLPLPLGVRVAVEEFIGEVVRLDDSHGA